MGDDERRYFQLNDMMEHYNADFDERKYWAYGCHCLILGDRPMSDMGHGLPVDALDTVCKKYKDCLKCARMTHGEGCVGEFHQYKYGYKNGDVVCRDNAGDCKRDLCECDAMFAREHVGVAIVFNQEFHMFWSVAGWDPKADPNICVSNGPGFPECCQNEDKTLPWKLHNSLSNKCCSNGSVVHRSEQC